MKFSKDGKYIKTWGKKGTAPGEFDIPTALAFDSKGRLFVGDRNNNRIQIFDQDGNFIEQWTQFSRPSGIFIDKNDVIYVADSESESVSREPRRLEARHPHRKRQGRHGHSVHSRSCRRRNGHQRGRRRRGRFERRDLRRGSRAEGFEEVREEVERNKGHIAPFIETGQHMVAKNWIVYGPGTV